MRDDYYRILQVDPGAHPAVVRAAYRTLLRVLGRHPDLGGAVGDAQRLVEAYRTLGNAERRQAYDVWLRAHGSPATRPPLPPGLQAWIRAVLADHRPAAAAPFADHFDLVLAGPGALAGLLYIRAQRLTNPAGWPAVFTLWRAVRLARSGLWPYADAILLAAPEPDGVPAFLTEAARPRTRRSINRCALAVCTFPPPRMHPAPGRMPRSVRRLLAACR